MLHNNSGSVSAQKLSAYKCFKQKSQEKKNLESSEVRIIYKFAFVKQLFYSGTFATINIT